MSFCACASLQKGSGNPWWARYRSILTQTSLKVRDYCHLRFSYFFIKRIKFIFFFSWFPKFQIDFSAKKGRSWAQNFTKNGNFDENYDFCEILTPNASSSVLFPLKTRNRNIKIFENFWLIFILLEHPKITVLTPVFFA